MRPPRVFLRTMTVGVLGTMAGARILFVCSDASNLRVVGAVLGAGIALGLDAGAIRLAVVTAAIGVPLSTTLPLAGCDGSFLSFPIGGALFGWVLGDFPGRVLKGSSASGPNPRFPAPPRPP